MEGVLLGSRSGALLREELMRTRFAVATASHGAAMPLPPTPSLADAATVR